MVFTLYRSLIDMGLGCDNPVKLRRAPEPSWRSRITYMKIVLLIMIMADLLFDIFCIIFFTYPAYRSDRDEYSLSQSYDASSSWTDTIRYAQIYIQD